MPKTWLEDRETLREMTKENLVTALRWTLVYALISHMRGKLHMSCYRKYHGGWRLGAYRLEGLEDQEKWIRWALQQLSFAAIRWGGEAAAFHEKMTDIAARVLDKSWATTDKLKVAV